MCPCFGNCEYSEECLGEENKCQHVSERSRGIIKNDTYITDAECALCHSKLEIKDFNAMDYFGASFVRTKCPMCGTEQLIRESEIHKMYKLADKKDFTTYRPLVDFMRMVYE